MALLDDIVEEAIRRKQLEAFNQALQEPSSVADRFVFGDPQLEAMEPTTQMQIGEKLQDYLGVLRKTFPEANPYGTAIEDFFLGGSEDLAREMTEGYKAVDFNNFMDANRPIIDPRVPEVASLIPVATGAKLATTIPTEFAATVGPMVAGSRIIEKSIENIKSPEDVFSGLYADALKAPSFEDFKKDYTQQIKHGKYYHITEDPNFRIDPEKGASDTMSYSTSKPKKGSLMVTSDLPYWAAGYGDSRKYVAEIDMSDVPRNQYEQVNRGQGNEFFIENASKAKVKRVVPLDEAIEEADAYNKQIPQSEEELREFYNAAKMQGKLGRTAQEEDTGLLNAIVGTGLANQPVSNVGIFAGEIGARNLAQAGDDAAMQALDLAQSMENAGATPIEIWTETAKTGYPVYRGVDGKLRFEIDDSQAGFNKQLITDIASTNRAMQRGVQSKEHLQDQLELMLEPGKLSDFFTHQKAFETYPDVQGPVKARYFDLRDKGLELQNRINELEAGPEYEGRSVDLMNLMDERDAITAEREALPFIGSQDKGVENIGYGFEKGVGGGYYSPRNDQIVVTAPAGNLDLPGIRDTARSTTLHEMQHAIQKREGFQSGGSPERFRESGALAPERAIAMEAQRSDPLFEQYSKLDQEIRDNATLERANLLFGEKIQKEFEKLETAYDARAAQGVPNDDPKLKELSDKMDELLDQHKALQRKEFPEIQERQELHEYLRKTYNVDPRHTLNPAKDTERLSADESYRRVAGEVEARLTEKRRDYTPAERAYKPAFEEFDRPVEQQLLKVDKDIDPSGFAPVSLMDELSKLTGNMPTDQTGSEAVDEIMRMVGYHGTPHRFPPTERNPLGEFDLQKIGTGEGNQAFGYGIYVAENPDTAKTYIPDRSYVGRVIKGKPGGTEFDAEWIAQTAVDEHGDNALNHLQTVLKQRSQSKNPKQIESNNQLQDAINLVKEGKIDQRGNLYEIDIPDEVIDNQMLDWDQPIEFDSPIGQKIVNAVVEFQFPGGQWSEAKQETIDELKDIMGAKGTYYEGQAEDGGSIYHHLTGILPHEDDFTGIQSSNDFATAKLRVEKKQKLTSEFLNHIGIKGIKYKDQASRGKKGGTRNFVLFDPDVATITGRN